MRKADMSSRSMLTAVSLLMFLFSSSASNSQEVLVNTSSGDLFVFELQPEETLGSIGERVAALLDQKPSSFLIEFLSGEEECSSLLCRQLSHGKGGYLGHPREYYVPVTPSEESDIRFILTSLANRSLISLALIKSELEAAGARIDHLHPFRFLMTVFMDEEMKVCVRNIRSRGWVWEQFSGGLIECLRTEQRIGNLKEEHTRDLARLVGIQISYIEKAIQQGKWDLFIDTLIARVPRKGDHDRYDCHRLVENTLGQSAILPGLE